MTTLFKKESRRVLAVWLPYLPADRILRQRLGRSWRSVQTPLQPPMVLSQRENNTQRIAALDERAEGLKLKPGMGMADARAMHPDIDVVEADPEADRRMLEALADWCDRFTPLVALDPPDGLFLDVTGCAHLFGGEAPMLDDLLTRLLGQGFHARAGLASTPGAAWAAARFMGADIVPPGEEEALMARLPLSALRIDPEVRGGLESVGLRTAGALLSTPRAPLVRRFGKSLLTRLDQAVGRMEEAISPRLPVPPLSVERLLAEPIQQREDIEGLVGLLAGTLKSDLERRGEGARALQLTLFRVDAAVYRIALGTSRPLRDPVLVRRLFHEKLARLAEDIDAGFGFELVRLSALAVARFDMEQTALTGEAASGGEALALFVDRVKARLGDGALFRPVPVASHVPERAVRLDPAVGRSIAAGKSSTPRVGRGRERPVRLFRHPEPVDVAATELPEGPPLNFRWRRAMHRVSRAEGPERIAPEWWREGEDAATRDYFRVEDAEGRRYWLFRQGLYGASAEPPRWFIHGIFA